MTTIADLELLAANTLSDEPRTALGACRQLSVDQLPWLTERAATHARRAGWSWRLIGQLLGTSGEAARKRFGHVDRPVLGPIGRGPARWAEDNHRAMAAHARQSRLATELAAWERSGIDIVPW